MGLILLAFFLPFAVGSAADLLIFNKPKEYEKGWPAAGPIFAVSTACACIVTMILLVTNSLG